VGFVVAIGIAGNGLAIAPHFGQWQYDVLSWHSRRRKRSF
jgi:hypothetical protein